MAIQRWTTSEVLAFRNTEALIGLIRETLAKYPEINNFAAVPIPQTTYKTLVQTALPSVGFRADNVGREVQKPSWEVRSVECKFLDASWNYDQKVSNEFAWGREFFLSEQTRAHLDSAMRKIAVQTWYGIAADATGFIGIMSYLNSLTVPTVINAGGTTANSATSVFAVSTGIQKVAYAWGQLGRIDDGPIVEVEKTDEDGKSYWTYAQKIHGHIGLQVGTPKCVGRICNITDTKPLDDKLMASLLNSFETGFEPDAFYMSRKARTMLQQSRTTYSPTGQPAPFPEEAWGIPIFITDAINNTEAIVT